MSCTCIACAHKSIEEYTTLEIIMRWQKVRSMFWGIEAEAIQLVFGQTWTLIQSLF